MCTQLSTHRRSPNPGRRLFLTVALVVLAAVSSAHAGVRDKVPHEKVIGVLINNVRYGQDKAVLTHLDGDRQARELLGPAYDQGTPEQRAEFITFFHHIFAGVAFPKMRDSFEHLTTITYAAKVDPASGGRVDVDSVIHIQAGPKEQELKVRYWLSKGTDGKLRVVDVTLVGDKSMLTNIREDQVKPILAEGGWPKLLELMRSRAGELPALTDKPLVPKK